MPLDLSPESLLTPITDPFTQFWSQRNYLFDPSPVSPLNYIGSTSYSKSASDAPLGFDNLFYGISAPVTFNTLESNLFNTYAVF